MNKNLIYAVIGLVVVGIAGVYLLTAGNPGGSDDTVAASGATLKSLLARSGSYRCTVSQEVAGSETSGTVYVANGQVRGDFVSTTNGEVAATHLIIADNTVYTWLDNVPIGFKGPIDQSTDQSTKGTDISASVDLVNQALGFDCQAQTVPAEQFALPTNVQFTGF